MDINYYMDEKYRNDEIIITDFKFGYSKKSDKYINNLKVYNFKNITYITHNYSINLNHLERFRIEKDILKKYVRGKLLITIRIHASYAKH